MIKVKKTSIEGFLILEPNCFKDERSFFLETNLEKKNQSRSIKDVIRGMHFQVNSRHQAQIITVMRGSVFDIGFDLRKLHQHLVSFMELN